MAPKLQVVIANSRRRTKTMAVRRTNYYMLCNLKDRLDALTPEDGGPVCYEDLPSSVLTSPWFEQREYFKTVLELSYCVRCKLPIPHSQASLGGIDICEEHYKTQAEAWERVRERRRATPLHRSTSVRSQDRYRRRVAAREHTEAVRLDLGDLADRAEINQRDNPTPAFDVFKMLDLIKKKN
jgi:hypothetical protein